MAIRIRTTEHHPHNMWQRLEQHFTISEIQGFIFECTDDEMIAATKASTRNIPIHCLEAVEYDTAIEFEPTSIFTHDEWHAKIHVAQYFGTDLMILTHCSTDDILFRTYTVSYNASNDIVFTVVREFADEGPFIDWWASIKKLSQTKATVEASPRQAKTIFDGIIEKHGLSWGGNIDGFILKTDVGTVVLILELRQSRITLVSKYDPAVYFLGTATKGGDFKTWLPLIYLKKAYNLPLALITLSTKSPDEIGYTEVFGINTQKLFYVDDISPKTNVTKDLNRVVEWLNNLIERNN